VLFHESPQSSAIFERALPILGEHLHVWAFDTPGYGESAPPSDEGHEIPEYGATLAGAIDALGIGRYAVGGVHTGASIAIEVALQAGLDRVVAGILTGVPMFTQEKRAEWLANWSPPLTLSAEGRHMQWAWERFIRIWGGETDPRLLTLGAVNLLAVAGRYEWAYNAAFRYDPEPALRGLDIPVLLLNAEGDLLAHLDPAVAGVLPQCQRVTIPEMTGQLAWRVPDLYATAVVNFLRDSTDL
jgi:haloalkane dehalogenase